MERIRDRRPRGIHRGALRTWGILFLLAGIIGKSILQFRLLGPMGGEALYQAMEDSAAMAYATAALALMALETCAVPIFACLLVEGVCHTGDWKRYLLRVTAVALVSEIPFNLAMSGAVVDLTGRNPAFGTLVCLVMLCFFRAYPGKTPGRRFARAATAAAAFLWCAMLSVEYGCAMVIVTGVLWAFRDRANWYVMAGAAGCVVCALISPFFLAAPMGMLAVHYYNGEPGEQSPWIAYAAYPVALTAVWLAGELLL